MTKKPQMLLMVWIGCFCFAAPMLADEVAVIRLIPLAELPIYTPSSPDVMTAWRNHSGADSENRPRRAGRMETSCMTEEGLPVPWRVHA